MSRHWPAICFGSLACWSQPRWKSWMKRTPRSASRRASRQLAAKVPGLRASGPYRSKVRVGLVREIGQLGHRRLHPERHLVLRDARGDLRIAELVELECDSSLARSSSIRRRSSAAKPGGIGQVEHRVADRAELDALVPASAESRCPRGGRRAADRSGCRCPARSSRRRPAGPGSRCPGRTTATRRCSAGRRAARRSGRR